MAIDLIQIAIFYRTDAWTIRWRRSIFTKNIKNENVHD